MSALGAAGHRTDDRVADLGVGHREQVEPGELAGREIQDHVAGLRTGKIVEDDRSAIVAEEDRELVVARCADAVRHPSHEGDLDVLRIEAAHLDDVLAGTEVPDQVDAVTLRVVVGILSVIAIEVVADHELGQLAGGEVAEDLSVIHAAIDRVVAALALHLVVAETAVDPVVAVATLDEVVIGAFGDRTAGDRLDRQGERVGHGERRRRWRSP